MPDAPRCVPCLNKGLHGQTFRLFGTAVQRFKCSLCGEVTYRDSLKDVELEWRTHPEDWLTHMSHRLNETGMKKAEKIVEIATL